MIFTPASAKEFQKPKGLQPVWDAGLSRKPVTER